MAHLEWLILGYLKAEHRPVPNNESFFIIEDTLLGRVLHLDALDCKQVDTMLAPLLIGEGESDDEDLADDEIIEKLRQLDERRRTLNERRAQIQAEPAEEPNIIDLVKVINRGQGDQEDEEDEEDKELAEENQDANAENN